MIENNWYYKLEIANIHQIEKALFFWPLNFIFMIIWNMENRKELRKCYVEASHVF